MHNRDKLATQGAQDEEEQNTIYVGHRYTEASTMGDYIYIIVVYS
jgi:ABC-type sugar transport system ATPase subunit